MRFATGSVDHTPTEMVLTRHCDDVSKIMCHVRINGDMLDHDLLVAFDGQLRASVSASLNGDLFLVALRWAGHPHGAGVALTVVASRSMYRPLVAIMIDHISQNQPIMAECDSRTDAALTRLVSTLPPSAAQLLFGQLDEALIERELSWRNVLSGVEEVVQDQPTPSLRHTRGVTPDDGDGVDEHLLARKHLKIKAVITTCADTSVQ